MTYVGDTTFAEDADAVFTVDAWGMDSLTRRFKGANTLLSDFLEDYAKDRTVADADFPYMFHSSHSATIGRAFSTVTIEYKGLINSKPGNTPEDLPPVFKSGYRTQDVSLPYVGDTIGQTTGAVAEITYSAPFTQIMYVTREVPKTRRFRNILESFEEGIQLLARRGSPGDITIHAGKTWKQSVGTVGLDVIETVQHYNGVAEVIPTQFEWEQAGQWYQVIETNEARVVPLDLANGLMRFFP